MLEFNQLPSLNEATRQDLITKSKKGSNYSAKNQSKGKNRWERKKYSSIPKNVKQYNDIDMNTFFKKDILTVGILIYGETDNYVVRIKFGGILRELQRLVKQNDNKLEFKTICRALTSIFNSNNVYIHCSCDDWRYRMDYFAHLNDIASTRRPDDSQNRPSVITNPHDTLGAGCKHSLLVLSNLDWMVKVASTINNYIHYMEEHETRLFADIIFPTIYGVKYDKAIQLGLFDRMYLKHSKGVIDAINDYGKKRTQFKKDPDKEETKPVEKDDTQISIDDIDVDEINKNINQQNTEEKDNEEEKEDKE